MVKCNALFAFCPSHLTHWLGLPDLDEHVSCPFFLLPIFLFDLDHSLAKFVSIWIEKYHLQFYICNSLCCILSLFFLHLIGLHHVKQRVLFLPFSAISIMFLLGLSNWIHAYHYPSIVLCWFCRKFFGLCWMAWIVANFLDSKSWLNWVCFVVFIVSF